jgi:hypothetical protein
MTPETHIIDEAMEESIREQQTVEITAALDSQNWANLADKLYAECEDYDEEKEERGRSRLYWGVDLDEDRWQIRLIGR